MWRLLRYNFLFQSFYFHSWCGCALEAGKISRMLDFVNGQPGIDNSTLEYHIFGYETEFKALQDVFQRLLKSLWVYIERIKVVDGLKCPVNSVNQQSRKFSQAYPEIMSYQPPFWCELWATAIIFDFGNYFNQTSNVRLHYLFLNEVNSF